MILYTWTDDFQTGSSFWYTNKRDAIKYARESAISESEQTPDFSTVEIDINRIEIQSPITKTMACRLLEGTGFASKNETVYTVIVKGKAPSHIY